MQNKTKKDIAEWSNRRYKDCKYICTHIGASQYIRQLLIAIKGEINSNTKRVGDFNTSLPSVETSFRHKINKETLTLNGTLVQIVLIDIYRAFCSKAANLRKLKSYEASFLITMLSDWKKATRKNIQNHKCIRMLSNILLNNQ